MVRSSPSPFAHGKSEIWERPALAKRIELEKKRMGARLRAFREAKELTQAAAAEAIGVHHNQVVRLETGRANATIGTLVACCEAYGRDLRDLFPKA